MGLDGLMPSPGGKISTKKKTFEYLLRNSMLHVHGTFSIDLQVPGIISLVFACFV